MSEERVAYRDGNTDLTGFRTCAHEWGNARHGVVVVDGGADLDEHRRERAVGVARLGYPALACDMYGNGVLGDR